MLGYSFIQPERTALFPALTEGGLAVKLAMPMSEDRSVLRTSLLPQLLDIAQYNVNRRQSDLALFEIGSVFITDEEQLTRQPREFQTLALLLTGSRAAKQWNVAPESVDFFDLKGRWNRCSLTLVWTTPLFSKAIHRRVIIPVAPLRST